jgi:hypothetical protein
MNMYPEDRIQRPMLEGNEVTEPIGRTANVGTYRGDGIRVEHHDDRSLGELFSELTRETQTLVRQEIELARTELTDRAKKAGVNAGFIGAGGAVAYAGFIVLMMGVAYLLATLMPLWLATVIVGLVVIGVGYMAIQKGMKGLKQTNFKLERTAVTLKEDKQWIKEEL